MGGGKISPALAGGSWQQYLDYNKAMFTGLSRGDDWNQHFIKNLSGALLMNQYRTNWPVILAALRQLWETGKVSELKSPFYEPVEKPVGQ